MNSNPEEFYSLARTVNKQLTLLKQVDLEPEYIYLGRYQMAMLRNVGNLFVTYTYGDKSPKTYFLGYEVIPVQLPSHVGVSQ